MRRRSYFLSGIFFLLVILFIANAIYVAADRPWRPPATGPMADDTEWVGGIHMHSRCSDGSGTVESMAKAAADVGLDYIIITDHNNVKALPEAGYHHGVLVVVGEERSMDRGHMVILGAPEVEGRGADSVAAAVARKGGMSIIAHPFGRRSWHGDVPESATGYEIINADSEWRDDSILKLLSSLAALPVLPDASWSRLASRHDKNLAVLDSISLVREIIPIGALDAHAAIELIGESLIPFPSYKSMFSLVRTHVLLEEPPTGDAEHDTEVLLRQIVRGRLFIAYDAFGDSRGFRFEVGQVDEISLSSIYPSPGSVSVDVPLPGPTRIRIFKDGVLWKEGPGPKLSTAAPPGVFRAEVYQERRFLRPWIFSSIERIDEWDDERAAGKPGDGESSHLTEVHSGGE